MQLPRLKIIHIMLIAGVLAIVFGVLNSREFDSVVGLMLLHTLFCLWFIFMALRPNPLKSVLANLPENPDEQITSLEEGLARRNHYDADTAARARYRLMQLYKLRERYEEAITQGRSILAMKGVKLEFENAVRVEIATCLDSLGRGDQAEFERMAVTDEHDDCPDAFAG